MSKEALRFRSEKWLRTFCNKISDCPGYEETMEAIANSDGDENVHFSGEDAHGEIPEEFWYHYEMVTGVKFDSPPSYFSCSC